MHTYTQAIQIFEAKADREVRDTLAASVAAQFGITAKAVRDIWNLRTWVQTTEPYWTQADHAHFLTKRPSRLCEECKARNVRSRSAACERCAGPPRRGRAHSATTIDECLGVRTDPKVCAAVHDVLAATAWIGEPSFFPMLDVYEESACEETPATIFSCQMDASACGDSDMFQCIDCLMEIDDEEDYACWGTGAEMLSRPGTVLTRGDDGGRVLRLVTMRRRRRSNFD